MFRRCYEYMFDELEIPHYPRWYASPNPVCYTVPDFSRGSRTSRCDFYAMDYPRQSYWMPQNWRFSNPEPLCFKRNDRRNHQPKSSHFPREKRNFPDQRCHDHRFERDDGIFRFERRKRGEVPPRFERRMHSHWDNDVMTNYHSPLHEERNPSRLSFRSSSVDLCADDFIVSHLNRNLKQPYGVSNSSAEYAAVNDKANVANNGVSESRVRQGSSAELSYGDLSENWQSQDIKVPNTLPSDCVGHESSSNFTSSYESWYCPQEQQQIIDTLKEVNLRHERQLRRDLLKSLGDKQCSDESMSSNNDSSCLESFPKQLSSEDDEDTINVLLSPSGTVSALEKVDEDEELNPGYVDQTAIDFFEEFQGIFTGSPEKQIINDLTKESLKQNSKGNGTSNVSGRKITSEDKDAVKNVLNFEDADEVACQELMENISKDTPSSPKETSVPLNQFNVKWSEKASTNISCESIFQNENHSLIPNAEAKLSLEKSSTFDCLPIAASDSGTSNKPKLSPDNSSLLFSNQNSYKNEVFATYKQLDRHDSIYDANKNKSVETCLKNSSLRKYLDVEKLDGIRGNVEKISEVSNQNASSNSSIADSKGHTRGFEKNILDEKFNQQSTVSCYNRNTPEMCPERKGSLSEPLLSSNKGETVYRRISVSEIFNSVNVESEKRLQILRKRQNHVNQFLKQSKPDDPISPSAHLKLILGIGMEAVKERNDRVAEHSGFLESVQNKSLKSFLSGHADSEDHISNVLNKNLEDHGKTGVSEETAKHSCCDASSRRDIKTVEFQAKSMYDQQTESTANVSRKMLKSPQKNKFEKHSSANTFRSSVQNMSEESPGKNAKLLPRELKNNCSTANLDLRESNKSVSSPKATRYAKHDTNHQAQKSSSHEEIFKYKSYRKRNPLSREDERNEKNGKVCESDHLKSNPSVHRMELRHDMQRNSDLLHKFELENKIGTSYDQDMQFQNSTQSPKPKKKFGHRKRREKFLEKSSYDRYMNYGDGGEKFNEKNMGDASSMYRDSFNSGHQHSRGNSKIKNVIQASKTSKHVSSQDSEMKAYEKENGTFRSGKERSRYNHKSGNVESDGKNVPKNPQKDGDETQVNEENSSKEKFRNSKQTRISSGYTGYSSTRKGWGKRTKSPKSSYNRKGFDSCKCYAQNHYTNHLQNGYSKQKKAMDLGTTTKPRDVSDKRSGSTAGNGKHINNDRSEEYVNNHMSLVASDHTKEHFSKRFLSENNISIIDSDGFENVIVEYQSQKMLVEARKSSYLINKIKLRSKSHDKGDEASEICGMEKLSAPHPSNYFFAHHVTDRKFALSVFKLKVKSENIPVVVVSTKECGQEETIFHLIKCNRMIGKKDVQDNASKPDKMHELKSLVRTIFGRQSSSKFIFMSDISCIFKTAAMTNNPKSLQLLPGKA